MTMTGFRICLVKVSQVFNIPLVLNIHGSEYARVKQGVKYALIMPQYRWICLNMPAYTWINRVPNIQKLWMCHRTNRRGVIQTGTYQRTVKQWSVLQKEPCLSTGSQPNIFPDRGGFMELRHFDNNLLSKNTRKKGQGNNFSPRYS